MHVYQRLGLRRVINADARLTRLGGSIMPPEVLAAMAEAAARHGWTVISDTSWPGGDDRVPMAIMAGYTRLAAEAARQIASHPPDIVLVQAGVGGLAGAADLFLDELARTVRARAQPIAARRVRIVASRLGGDANLLGAARLAWEAAAKASRA